MALKPHELKALAMELAAALPPVPASDPMAQSARTFAAELSLNYVEAALEAHRESFSENEERNRKMQWAVTGLLERAQQLLNHDVYGDA